MDCVDDFGKRLRFARMNSGFTQPELAKNIGVALRTYQCYEQGTRRPPFEVLVELCLVLNVSSDYLLGLTDEVSVDEH